VFSIIIPLHNKADYVEKSINSVLEQTYENFELIIINDGSTDNSLSIVQQFNDLRIEIVSQKNQGVSAARNNGVLVAKYEYIVFLDADDWWDINFLEEMYKLLIGYPEAGLYACGYNIVKNNKLVKSKVGVNSEFTANYIDYFKVYTSTFWVPINCSFVVIMKSVFNNVGGFNEGLKFGEDFHLWVRVALKYKIAYLNENLSYSNQDVDINQRALGANKIYSPPTHFIFNLAFLEQEESQNSDLKKLMDGLRVRSLIRYHLSGKYKSETALEIAKVNFEQQSKYFNFIYKYPRFLVRFYFFSKKKGSIIKQTLIKRKLLR
jgi:glycosyltransferase involved in cell wall biosynthesis